MRKRKPERAPYDNDKIRAEMTRTRKKVDDVARIAGVSAKTVSAIRAGNKGVQVDNLQRVVEAVGLKLADVIPAAA